MNNLVQFLHVCVEIWKIVEKIKTNLNKLLIVLIMKKKCPTDFAKVEVFSFSKPKVVYLRPFLFPLPFDKF